MSDNGFKGWWDSDDAQAWTYEEQQIYDCGMEHGRCKASHENAYLAGMKASPYKQAVEDALTCWEMTLTGDAKADLNKLLVLTQQVALDPLVCSDAKALYDSGVKKGMEKAEEIADLHYDCSTNTIYENIDTHLYDVEIAAAIRKERGML
jgi:hypothetical protein